MAGPAGALQPRELIEDEGLRLPKRIEQTEAMTGVVDEREAGGKVRKVDPDQQLRRGEEALFIDGEAAERPASGVAGIGELAREGRRVGDRVARQPVGVDRPEGRMG